MSISSLHPRHHRTDDGRPRPYKGYLGGSNFCIEIVRGNKDKWEGEVIPTFEAYRIAKYFGEKRLHHPTLSISGKPLVMRLMIDDCVRMADPKEQGKTVILRVCKIEANGNIYLYDHRAANVSARTTSKSTDKISYTVRVASSLQKYFARRVTISVIGKLRDPGFKQ